MKEEHPFERVYKHLPFHKIILNNFIGGIAWAFGATIGLSLILAILGLIAHNINFVPVVGSFASQVIDFVLNNNPNLHK